MNVVVPTLARLTGKGRKRIVAEQRIRQFKTPQRAQAHELR